MRRQIMKLGGDRVALGGWCTIPSSFSIEVMSRAGFDWICFDLQHAMIDVKTAMTMLQAAAISSVPTLVRVSSHNPAELQHMLDAGAAGVAAPTVNSADEARNIVQACRYPPKGRRSWGPVRPALVSPGYSTTEANEHVICGVMVETREGLEHLDEIVRVEGVDLVLVGSNDLAVNLGLVPRHGIVDDQHRSAIARIAERCLEFGVTPAINGGDVAGSLEFISLGYRAVLVATDALLIADGAAEALSAVKKGVQGLEAPFVGAAKGTPEVGAHKGGRSR
jgi:4-hydroxy-2-oxoheptanedioate aldolase